MMLIISTRMLRPVDTVQLPKNCYVFNVDITTQHSDWT